MSEVMIPTGLSQAERLTLADIADTLIPARMGFPSASEAGVAGDLLDRALIGRPDRLRIVSRLIGELRTADDLHFALRELERQRPLLFVALMEAVTGAYVLNPEVQDRLGYHGQQRIAIDTDAEDYTDLLPIVLERGPVYRATR
jgi:hypothetical protein